MNIKLLRRIQKQILKEPRQFFMRYLFSDQYDVSWKIPNCGTAACIAGWAIALSINASPKDAKLHSKRISFAKMLGVRPPAFGRLIFEYQWPVRFRYGESPKQRATLAVARIDHFIKTKGRE